MVKYSREEAAAKSAKVGGSIAPSMMGPRERLARGATAWRATVGPGTRAITAGRLWAAGAGRIHMRGSDVEPHRPSGRQLASLGR